MRRASFSGRTSGEGACPTVSDAALAHGGSGDSAHLYHRVPDVLRIVVKDTAIEGEFVEFLAGLARRETIVARELPGSLSEGTTSLEVTSPHSSIAVQNSAMTFAGRLAPKMK
jgi:hypothetical protein